MEGGLACKGQHARFEGKVELDVSETERQEEMAEKRRLRMKKVGTLKLREARTNIGRHKTGQGRRG